jgi:hypothetical protein
MMNAERKQKGVNLSAPGIVLATTTKTPGMRPLFPDSLPSRHKTQNTQSNEGCLIFPH